MNNRYFDYLPGAGLKSNLGRQNSIDIQWSVRNLLPQLYDVLPGNIITSATEVFRGSGNVNFGLSKSLALAYSFAEPVKRKLVFFCGTLACPGIDPVPN